MRAPPADSDIVTTTRRYEAWIARQVSPVAEDLAFKHAQMATTPFRFLRGSFYRWAQSWPVVCPSLATAPQVLAVGDLHIDNFSTWRDDDGRLVWGINDFSEAFTMPYANDLVRLATSALLAARENALAIMPGKACAAILDGYRAGIADGGGPFILEREYRWLRQLAIGELRDPLARDGEHPSRQRRGQRDRTRSCAPPGRLAARGGDRDGKNDDRRLEGMEARQAATVSRRYPPAAERISPIVETGNPGVDGTSFGYL